MRCLHVDPCAANEVRCILDIFLNILNTFSTVSIFSTNSRQIDEACEAVYLCILTAKMGSGTSFNWLNIVANAASVTIRPPKLASALACAQEAEPCAELLADVDAVLVFALSALALGMMLDFATGYKFKLRTGAESGTRLWTPKLDASWSLIGAQFPAKLCTASGGPCKYPLGVM